MVIMTDPEYLYHYKELEYGLDELENQRMWLARLDENSESDPDEGRANGVDEKTESMIIHSPLTERQRECIRRSYQDLYDGFRSKARTISMTDDPLNRYMWVEYAKMSGICICYREKSLVGYNIICNPVNYTDKEIQTVYLRNFETAREACMRKGTKFANEREYRHLHFATECNPETIGQRFMKAPKPVCVYIGEDAELEKPEIYRRICDYCKSTGIHIRTAHREELRNLGPRR